MLVTCFSDNRATSTRTNNTLDALRVEIMDKVNQLGIGAQGLGGLTTVLDVKINVIELT